MDWDEFKNLDLAEIGHWPRPAKLIVWGVLLLFISYMTHQLLIQDQLKALGLAEREERTLKLQFENQYRVAARLASRQQKNSLTDAKNIATNSVASLLEQISQAGANNRVEFLLFQPEPEVNTKHYTELPIRIRVAGNYHSFGHFISELAGMSQTFGLQELNIKRADSRGRVRADGGTDQRPLIMELVAKRYRLPAQGTEGRGG